MTSKKRWRGKSWEGLGPCCVLKQPPVLTTQSPPLPPLCDEQDKVILSIAIIPMAQEMGWSPSVAGLVQSSFFYGYILVQLPGGYIITRTGGRRILPLGVGLWSLATAAVPFAVATIPTLCVARSLVGLGQGVAPASASDLIARTVPNAQRSGAVARVFSGLQLGSIAALFAGPAIIQALGWRASFYIFGASGVLWCVWWEQLLSSTYDSGTAAIEKAAADEAAAAAVAAAAPAAAATAGALVAGEEQQVNMAEDALQKQLGRQLGAEEEEKVPWRAFLREPAMQGLMYVHFCNNWCVSSPPSSPSLPSSPSPPSPCLPVFTPLTSTQCPK